MLSDIEIAQAATVRDIGEIAAKVGLPEEALERYGNFKAKIKLDALNHISGEEKSVQRLVLVTAINPTPAGEGKTTTTVGLCDALNKLGKSSVVALREPSLGPVFGIKGGAAGGGYAQVVPMEDINLHFTGDFHAIGAANNLLAALIDNHIQQGNELGFDVRKITWKRCVDMNDRQLRHIVCGLGGKASGVPREDGFDITVASEIMAVFCLSNSLADLKERLGRIIVGYTREDEPLYARDLNAQGALTALLKDALKPNLVQTLEGNPAFVHGGPFANIAHGCNSILATKLGMAVSEYCITEAGFGADLGAEKFFDITCRAADITPDAVVLVATVRALKYNGGLAKDELNKSDVEALKRGLPNLERHIENITQVFGLPCVVALNQFPSDTDEELAVIEQACKNKGVRFALSQVHAHGSQGGLELARQVVDMCDEVKESSFAEAYKLKFGVEDKIKTIAQKVYRARDVQLTTEARADLKRIERLGMGDLPICMAKTQYSFSDNPSLLGAPQDFDITIRQLRLCAGAGFIVALTGTIMTMPGLPKSPAACRIDVDDSGNITGLF